MNPSLFRQILFLLFVAAWALPLHAYDPNNREEYLAKIKQAEAYYKDKCATVAGIKIHKTVPDVDGLLLLKIRPNRGDRELADPNWPGAAFGGEAYGDGFITSFLGYEYRVVNKDGVMSPSRGYIGTTKNPGGLPGYRWVEVIDPKDGQRYRYSGRYDKPWKTDSSYSKSYVRFNLDKTLSPSKTSPRYGVTFEDHVIPEERALWVANSTVKVLDLETDEVLGEMTRYAISYIHSPRRSMPWLNHSICPTMNMTGDLYSTRQFVDQILIPKKEQ